MLPLAPPPFNEHEQHSGTISRGAIEAYNTSDNLVLSMWSYHKQSLPMIVVIFSGAPVSSHMPKMCRLVDYFTSINCHCCEGK